MVRLFHHSRLRSRVLEDEAEAAEIMHGQAIPQKGKSGGA